jgi:hypothetical protein
MNGDNFDESLLIDLSDNINTREILSKAINRNGLSSVLCHLAAVAKEASDNNPEYNWDYDASLIESIIPFIDN